MKIAQDQEFYLTESLKQHPSAFIIFDKDLRIKWMNNSSKYIFTCDDEKDLKIRGVFSIIKMRVIIVLKKDFGNSNFLGS